MSAGLPSATCIDTPVAREVYGNAGRCSYRPVISIELTANALERLLYAARPRRRHSMARAPALLTEHTWVVRRASQVMDALEHAADRALARAMEQVVASDRSSHDRSDDSSSSATMPSADLERCLTLTRRCSTQAFTATITVVVVDNASSDQKRRGRLRTALGRRVHRASNFGAQPWIRARMQPSLHRIRLTDRSNSCCLLNGDTLVPAGAIDGHLLQALLERRPEVGIVAGPRLDRRQRATIGALHRSRMIGPWQRTAPEAAHRAPARALAVLAGLHRWVEPTGSAGCTTPTG